MTKLFLVGIGFRPLTERGSQAVRQAGVILASPRLYEVFQSYREYPAVREKIQVIDKVSDTLSFLKTHLADPAAPPVALLASGDPLFYGIGRLILAEFGREIVEILPDLSSVQAAFAAIGEPWDNALLVSLHGGPFPTRRPTLAPEDIPELLRRHPKLAILTDEKNSPAAIAAALQGKANARIHVCQRLGHSDESIREGDPREIARMTAAEPNVMIIRGEAEPADTGKLVFGLREEEIVHRRGLITKDEIRAVALHKLQLPRSGTFWDIGAGSGAVALEAALLSPGLRVLAIEKNPEHLPDIERNKALHRLANLEVAAGEAPEALAALPGPDRVFIGGSGGRLRETIAFCAARATPLIVVNAATLETLNEAVAALAEAGYKEEITTVSVARSRKIGGKRAFRAMNPIFIVRGTKSL